MSNKRITLAIYGLTFGGTESLFLEQTFAKVPGVVRAYVNGETEMAYIEYDSTQCKPEHLAEAVKEVGFGAGEPIQR